MVISLFLLFAPFCWLSVALSSDSDVPAEAAGIADMGTMSERTLLVIFTRVGGNRDSQIRRMEWRSRQNCHEGERAALTRYSGAIFARPSPDNEPVTKAWKNIFCGACPCGQGRVPTMAIQGSPSPQNPSRLVSSPALDTLGDLQATSRLIGPMLGDEAGLDGEQ
jgi:hypothetical protein